jgi:hypothetical protein
MEGIEYVDLEGTRNGNPVTYRAAKAPPEYTHRFPHHLTILWEYAPQNAGLASEETNKLQNQFEDITDWLEEENFGILALVVFGNGRKEWNWYVADLGEWMKAFNDRLKNYPPFPIGISHRENDGWKFHQAFLKWANLA